MRKVIAVLAALLLIGTAARAQRDTLWLSDIYTTHMKFDTEIMYVDISSTQTVVAMVLEQNKNYLAIKARTSFPGYSSVSVLEANEQMHTYIVGYRESPQNLNIVCHSVKDNLMSADGSAGAVPGMGATMKAAKEAEAAYSTSPRTLSLAEAVNLPQTSFHIADSKYDITVYCENILIYKDMLYFVLSLKNDSGINFACSDATFVIESKKKQKRSLEYEQNLYYKNVSGNLSTAPGHSSRVAYCFDGFTLLDSQVLKVYIYESSGQRDLVLTLQSKDINKARIWK